MKGAIVGGAMGPSIPRLPAPPPPIRARVTFLGVAEPVLSQRAEVIVEVPHITRAESVARKQGYPPHVWHLYGVVEIRPDA